MVTQATNVLFAEESGQWMGRLSYMLLWTSLKKSSASQSRRRAPRADRRGVLRPRGVQRPGRRVTQAVAAVLGIQRRVEEEDAVRECVRQVRGGRVEDALGRGACRAEPAEGDAQGEAQVVGGGFGVKFLDVLGERSAFGAVDGGLSPVLGVTPRGGAGAAELDGGFAVRFVNAKGCTDLVPDGR